MPQQVELTVFSSTHRDLLERWLAAPHVAPWYPEPAEHIAWALSPPLGGERALIVTRGNPVGYIRWQLVSRTTLDSVGLFEIPANSADVDLLIGEPAFVGHGIEPRALQLLTEALRARGDVPLIGLTTSVHNHAARRAFEITKGRIHDTRRLPGIVACDGDLPVGLLLYADNGREIEIVTLDALRRRLIR